MTIEKLRNLNQSELKKINNLINNFESKKTHANANTLASEIRKWLADEPHILYDERGLTNV